MIEWRNGHENLLDAKICLFSLPGVGNIGKAAIDALNSTNDATEIARLHHTALPPLATLDEDGLLSPPHFLFEQYQLAEVSIYLHYRNSQPLEPNNQGVLAREILELMQEYQV